jgi:hypothetical protein
MISFVTPYWCGRELMRIHLASIRRFYPQAPILISKKDEGAKEDVEEMEAHRAEFGIRYWVEDYGYLGALLRLLKRCETEYVCICDHDTVLLSSLDLLLQGLVEGRYELVGMEERLRVPDRDEWMRFALGWMDCNFMMFNLRQFLRTWGLRGIKGKRAPGVFDWEETYGICQKLKRHKYLLPFHARKYGCATLLKDGETPIVWHLWYGSYQKRQLDNLRPDIPGHEVAAAERAFLADYPDLDLSGLSPAWGPDCNVLEARAAFAQEYPVGVRRWLALAVEKFGAWRSRP